MDKFTLGTAVAAVALAAGVALTPSAQAAETIAIDGSSTVFPITEAMAEEFMASRQGEVQVTVGISGTGGGFKKFCRGETDISDASRPILKKEMEECAKNGIQYVELPVAFDALTVAVSPKNEFLNSITVEQLKMIWEPAAQGQITSWNQVNSDWPDEPLTLYGAGSDSGTFDYFTEAIVGKAKESRGDYTGSEDDNVLVQGIENDANALGYIPYAYFEPHKDRLKPVAIIHKGGKAVLPSKETVISGEYQPLSRPLFIYVKKESLDNNPAVREFVDFYLSKDARALIEEVKYVPLPDEAYDVGMERVTKAKLGTGFNGEPEVGLPIGDILKKEPVS
jgi:phosphate transport system substrate-binding protein